MSLFRLRPEAQERAEAAAEWLRESQDQFVRMSNASLVATAKFYARQMEPIRFAPGEPVYDATMWHVIVPELIRRLEVK
ncbi:hypothetical protein [Shinella zoogloeoides]|uniref:hypothetical protein n=1 Tax=Shinella zoogloeoides TaxID=352475 RepID=UPI00299CF842|nr:hypothetical protein [Shinella zoogloeoides]WPE19940.1 hypothetical protein ShzoTeo12_11180 [Shinella zoogloeoides]